MHRVFILFFLLIIFPPLLQAATIVNDYLLADVDEESGRFFLAAVKGKKNDLLFYDRPPSSYTVIFIDGDAIVFGSEGGTFTRRAINIGKSIVVIWETEKLSIEQNVRFIGRKKTSVEDGVLISYRIDNKTDKALKVGLRILFDTNLGETGNCHFHLPDSSEVCAEKELTGVDLPSFWISGSDPSICLMGTLKGDAMNQPDRIIFANYRALWENMYHYRVKRRRSFNYPPFSMNDSAVALYYNSDDLPGGASRLYQTILSLCGEGEFIQKEEREEKKEMLHQVEEGAMTTSTAQKSDEDELKKAERDVLQNELMEVETLFSQLKELDAIIDRLNAILGSESKDLDREESAQLRKRLKELGIQENEGQ